MNHIYLSKRLVEVVYKEASDRENPTIAEAKMLFCNLDGRYDDRTFRKAMAIATGCDYLGIVEPTRGGQQRLRVGYKGVILLSKIGYINELSGSMGNAHPFLATFISLLALFVSFFALFKP